jgi:hypothetical protein
VTGSHGYGRRRPLRGACHVLSGDWNRRA